MAKALPRRKPLKLVQNSGFQLNLKSDGTKDAPIAEEAQPQGGSRQVVPRKMVELQRQSDAGDGEDQDVQMVDKDANE